MHQNTFREPVVDVAKQTKGNVLLVETVGPVYELTVQMPKFAIVEERSSGEPGPA